MSTVDLNVTLGPVQFPANTVLGNVVATLTGSDANAANVLTQTVAAGSPVIEFLNVNPDTWTYSVQQQDGNGAALGTAITGTVVVAAPTTVTLNVPVAVQASVTS